MEIREINAAKTDLSPFADLSAHWENEQITWGLRANKPEELTGMRIFGAYENEMLVGYITATAFKTDCPYAMVPTVGTHCWEIEELYVIPELRSHGIGRQLYAYAESIAKSEGAEFLFLSTATKDYKRILHFYIDELGMDFWTARLYKKL